MGILEEHNETFLSEVVAVRGLLICASIRDVAFSYREVFVYGDLIVYDPYLTYPLSKSSHLCGRLSDTSRHSLVGEITRICVDQNQILVGTGRGEVVVFELDANTENNDGCCGHITARMQTPSEPEVIEDRISGYKSLVHWKPDPTNPDVTKSWEDEKVIRESFYPQDDAPYSLGTRGGPGTVTGVCFGTTAANGSCVVTTFQGHIHNENTEHKLKPMLRVCLMPAAYGPRKSQAIAERTNVVKARHVTFCSARSRLFGQVTLFVRPIPLPPG